MAEPEPKIDTERPHRAMQFHHPVANHEHLVEKASVQPCPKCGNAMSAIAGSRDANCEKCGYKESCCY